jgi:hypothetical protein
MKVNILWAVKNPFLCLNLNDRQAAHAKIDCQVTCCVILHYMLFGNPVPQNPVPQEWLHCEEEDVPNEVLEEN